VTFIAPIVEGHGELQAIKRLLGRIARDAAPYSTLRVNEPIRVKSGSFVNDMEYRNRYVSLAAAKARQQTRGHVLIVLDCEDDCPAELGPRLLRDAEQIAADVPMVVALAYREYETWFLAAAASLADIEGLPVTLTPPPDPEKIRDAKGWLGRQMPHGYDPISHQLPLTNAFDLSAARSIASFDRLYRKIFGLML
jgi:Domain of unknown function (DUF4276)